MGTGIVGAPECGDVMKLQIKINVETQVVEDARFKTFGCGSAIASSSLATEWVKGKTVDEALKIKNTDIVERVSLPPVKIPLLGFGRRCDERLFGIQEKRNPGGTMINLTETAVNGIFKFRQESALPEGGCGLRSWGVGAAVCPISLIFTKKTLARPIKYSRSAA